VLYGPKALRNPQLPFSAAPTSAELIRSGISICTITPVEDFELKSFSDQSSSNPAYKLAKISIVPSHEPRARGHVARKEKATSAKQGAQP
jgi:hypothetical protein